MQITPKVVLRAYLKEIEPKFRLPRAFAGHLILCDPRKARIYGLKKEHIPKGCRFALDVYAVEERNALEYALSATNAIRIASSCSVWVAEHYIPSRYSIRGDEKVHYLWGHGGPALQEEEMKFVENHMDMFREYLMPETYTRVGNALRLHSSAMFTDSPDLALLGFMGAIESLFSISPQELTFRLSLLLAKFLGNDKKQQRELFDRARGLYSVRSKLAHGDKLEKNEEAAAISLVDYWTPSAEKLARECLKRLFGQKLTKSFDSPKTHEALLTDLLFASNLDEISTTGASPAPQPKSSCQANSTMKQCSAGCNPSHKR